MESSQLKVQSWMAEIQLISETYNRQALDTRNWRWFHPTSFHKSPILSTKSDCGSVNTDLDGVQLKVELQPKTCEVAGTSVIIDT